MLKNESGDSYWVRLDKIIGPAQGADQFTTPDHGMQSVGVVFIIQGDQRQPQGRGRNNDAAVVGSNRQTYTVPLQNPRQVL